MRKLLEKPDPKTRWLLAGVLFLLAFFQYANTFTHGFAWDDDIVIVRNDRVQEGFAGIPKHFQKYNSDKLIDSYGYRPIVLTSFAIDHAVFGMSPGAMHIMNAIFYGICCAVLFFAVLEVFPGLSAGFALVIVLLFAVHPLHVEAVANIKSRDEIFGLLFPLLALIAYLRLFRGGHWGWGFAASGCFVLGFLSKESAISFLAVLPLSLLVQEELNWKRIGWFTLPLPVLLIGAALAISFSGSSTLGVEETTGAGIFHENGVLGNSLLEPHFYSQRIATALGIALRYLRNFFFPWPLVYYYGYNYLPLADWSDPFVYVSLLVNGALLAYGIYFFRKDRYTAFGIFFYFISLSVYLHILRPLADTMADRFMFTPSAGLCIALAGLMFRFLGKGKTETQKGKRKKQPAPANFFSRYPLITGLTALLVLVFTFRTFDRNRVWENNLTLFETDLPELENCARAHYYYAGAVQNKHAGLPKPSGLENTIILHYKRAIEISEHTYYARLDLARFYNEMGFSEEALKILNAAIPLFPDQTRLYHHAGVAHFISGNFGAAEPLFRQALDLAPKRQDTRYFLAGCYLRAGRYAEAIALSDEGLALAPDALLLYDTKADGLFATGRTTEAFALWQKIIELDPTNGSAYQKIVQKYQETGDENMAARYYQQAKARGLAN